MGILVVGARATALASEAIEAGYRDFSFPSGTGGNNRPTGEKPESKLWWNDGFWWGVLWSTAGGAYHIHYLDITVQEWVDTGVAVDDRQDSRADVLWDGEYLYVASHVFKTSGGPAASGERGELYRFRYDMGTMTYTLEPGFPVEVSGGKSETLVVEMDSTLQLWVTYVESGKVMVNHTRNGDDSDWATPFVLPVNGAGAVDSDDVSSIIAFDGHIGVLWSNQESQLKMYFAVHEDGRPPDEWDGGPAYSASGDDHINLATLGYDVAGQVFAVVKTAGSGASIVLLVCESNMNRCRSEADWAAYTVYDGDYSPTRSIVLIDEDNRELYVFTRHRDGGQSSIYYKRTSIDNIDFPSGAGVPFIKSSSDDAINDPTSTKQNVDTTTGLVVLASDEGSKHYFHNHLDLAGGSASTTSSTSIATTTTSTTTTTTSTTTSTTAAPTTTTLLPTTTSSTSTTTATSTSAPPTTTLAATTTSTISTTTTTSLPTTTTTLPLVLRIAEVRVASRSDDAEEGASGRMDLTSSDLEMVYDGSDQRVGMRFAGVMIPRGAVVELAYLQFKVDEKSLVSTDLTIVGEATGNAQAFSSLGYNISSRSRTTAEVSWPGVVEWPVVGAAGLEQRSPDMSAVIQEIVSRADWAEGNGLAIIISGSGERVAEAYDGDPDGAPLLHVEYRAGDGSSSTTTTSTSTTTSTTGLGVCGDHQLNPATEACDGPEEDDACPGFCLADCRCGVVNIRVTSSSDDAEESASGRMDLTSSDLEMVYDKSNQRVGMRFAGVMIPRGAVVELAYLQFKVDEKSLVRTDLTIVGEATGNARGFSSLGYNISSRSRTTAEVSWPGVVEWSVVGAAGLEQRSPDMSAVIQEIVSRADWAEGNGLAIIISGSGERVAEAYDGDAGGAPLLHVKFHAGD